MSGPGNIPPPPDPTATAAAQAQTNKETAVAQYGLNATNQVTPYGNLTYKQIGTWPDGTPRFESTQSLSPEEQNLYNQYTANQQKLGQIGGQQIDRVGNLLSTPLNIDTSATEARTMDLARQRLDPIIEQQQNSLQAKLANQGIVPGSEAWKIQMDQADRSRNDAYNNLILSGHSSALNDLLTSRNQPINEITALMSGSQVQQPGFTNTPQSQIASPDLAGMTYQSYQMGPLAQYQANNQYNQALLGGLFGLGGAAAGAAGRFYGAK